jgi:predicted MPP superfamily phosphohydrolase
LKKIGLALILCLIVCWAFWNKPVIRSYTIESPKINKPIKIVQLSDLHNNTYVDNQKCKR